MTRLNGWRRRFGLLPLSLVLSAAALFGGAGAFALAAGSGPGPGDLLAISQGSGQDVPQTALINDTSPADVATPTTPCGPGSHPLTGYADGRVPQAAISSPQAAQGWTCNLTEIAHQGTSGGFKTWTYTDPHGHFCVYYDTALLFPMNAVNIAQVQPSLGVAVLDMTDPAHPVQTATLTSIPMLSPHESLSLNAKRGLLGAVSGNPATYPGDVAFYSLSQDCRHPVLDYTGAIARFGHEGVFSPDGNTFWATSSSTQSTTAIDVSDPSHPHVLWQGKLVVHGLSFSDDGDVGYLEMPTASEMDIVDVSQIQNRVPNPVVRMISRITWPESTIPQSSYPMLIHGHHDLLEFDEYAFTFSKSSPPNTVGAARIIDVADPAHPNIIANLRLQVDQPAEHAAAANDPGALSFVQGYAAHYCGIPREVDPEIVACSFINSGLRIFNISDPVHPREVAYFVSPPKPADENGGQASDFAMSKPSFDPATQEVFYTDGTTGFYVVKLDKGIWPHPLGVPAPRTCVSPTGGLHGTDLAALRLGEPQARARATYNRYSTRGRRHFDFYCLSGGGLRAGYLHGRIALELTSDRFYGYRGVRPGDTLASAIARGVKPAMHFDVGLNTWYVIRGAAANGVFKVRHGQVQEIGLATKAVTATRALGRVFFRSFGDIG